MRSRLITALTAAVLVATQLAAPLPAYAVGDCVHPVVRVFADGSALNAPAHAPSGAALGDGAVDAGTGQLLTFQARTFAAPDCALSLRDKPRWQVTVWPCQNRPAPGRGPVALRWSLRVPTDCRVAASPRPLEVRLSTGRAAVGRDVLVYAGSPGWRLPPGHLRGTGTVSALTGALSVLATDASVRALGQPLVVSRSYHSDDRLAGPLGPGWRAAYTDRLVLGRRIVYQASDGREIGFDSSYAVEHGTARLSLSRRSGGFVLTTPDRVRLLFDRSGALTAIRDRYGQGVKVRWVAGRLRSVENGQRSLRYLYAGERIAAVLLIGPGEAARTVRYSYQDGRLATVTSPAGLVTRYGYDTAGRLRTVGTDAAETTTLYDTEGRVTEQVDAHGNKTTWSWDIAGGSGSSTVTDPAGGRRRAVYERGWLVEQVDPTGMRTRSNYDAEGNLIRVLDALGNGVRHDWDRSGRLTSTTDATGAVTRWSYSPTGDLVSVTDPLGRVTASGAGLRRDRRGLVVSSRDALGRTTRYHYSPAGDLVRITDPVGRQTAYRVDGWGRIVAIRPPRGAAAGERIRYDGDDRVVERIGPLGVTIRRSYDPAGRLASETDGRGGVTRYRYDPAGWLVEIQGPDSSLPAARIEYDATGRMVHRVDPGGRTQNFRYDAAGRLTGTTSGGRSWRFGYDDAGRLVRTTLPSGKSALYQLDPRGAVLRVSYSDGTPPVSFGWDPAGRRTRMVDATGLTAYRYDRFDRLVAAGPVRYRWDAVGNLLSRTAGGQIETFGWDAVDRLVSVRLDGRLLARYRYASDGAVTVRRPGGRVELRRYDERDRPVSVSLRSGRTVRSITGEYDAAGNLVRTNDSAVGQTRFGYDPLNRLTEACIGAERCVRYRYDGSGNRTFESSAAGTVWSAYGLGNELLGTLTVPRRYPLEPFRFRAYAYDADGNQALAGPATTVWNAAGKPVWSTVAGVRTSYLHNGAGDRVAESSGGQTTRYQWDPLSGQVLVAAGTRFGYGTGLLAESTGGRSTDILTGLAGSVLDTGIVVSATASKRGNPALGVAGGIRLPNGNYLVGQREYDPATARFLSPDQRGGTHPYAWDSAPAAGPGWTPPQLGTVAAGCTAQVVCAPIVPYAGCPERPLVARVVSESPARVSESPARVSESPAPQCRAEPAEWPAPAATPPR